MIYIIEVDETTFIHIGNIHNSYITVSARG